MVRKELGASQSEESRVWFYIWKGSFLHLLGLEHNCFCPSVCVQAQHLDLPLIKCKTACCKIGSALSGEKRIETWYLWTFLGLKKVIKKILLWKLIAKDNYLSALLRLEGIFHWKNPSGDLLSMQQLKFNLFMLLWKTTKKLFSVFVYKSFSQISLPLQHSFNINVVDLNRRSWEYRCGVVCMCLLSRGAGKDGICMYTEVCNGIWDERVYNACTWAEPASNS